VHSLPEDRPWGVTVLGRELVVWKDGEGQWRVFDDSCPHRKVALSEGRKEADGTLACAYHGWRFDGACALFLVHWRDLIGGDGCFHACFCFTPMC
jgi:phenylpropionate dioxygenase-like ring-hydroxylating dioxygenase large terminal subunit